MPAAHSVLLEFVADLAPNSTLLPKDPVQRAQTRFFIDAVSTKFVPRYAGWALRGEPVSELVKAFEDVQALLPADAKFAVGDEVTIADLAILPFVARIELLIQHEMLDGTAELGAALKEPRLERAVRYFEELKARKSFKETFDAVSAAPRRWPWEDADLGCLPHRTML
jgi:glutathione S-transferase